VCVSERGHEREREFCSLLSMGEWKGKRRRVEQERERGQREGYTTICAIVVALLSRGAYLCEAQPIFIALVL
jgi:hypothetical protein